MMSARTPSFQFPEVRVVEASAGSGKTYALAKRYVQLLLYLSQNDPILPIRQILAITFTNKAAFEMKGRILDFLRQLAFKTMPVKESEEILGPLGLDPDEAAGRAFAAMESVIHHYNFFQVQTIDKFINALLSGCAFKLGLTAIFKIRTNAKEYLEYSLDNLIEQAQGDPELNSLFEEFLNNYLYLENRTGWFPKKDMLDTASRLFGQYNTYGASFLNQGLSTKELRKEKAMILEEMRAFRPILPEGINKTFLKGFDKFLTQHDKGFDIDSLSKYWGYEDLPLRKGTEAPADVLKQWARLKKRVRQLSWDEAHSLFLPYVNIFDKVLDGFYAQSAKDDVLFLSELNKKARHLFDSAGITVEELYYRLATRFHHYLMDEFQDTSRLQWQNLMLMPEEALSTGGSLFYVGDKKQAIYSFRGGDVNLFDDVQREFHPFNVQVETLTQNWRSQQAIVDFNNKIFSMDNLSRFIQTKEQYEQDKPSKAHAVHFSSEDMEEVQRVFGSARQKALPDLNRGYVEVQYVDIDKREERDQWVRDRILEQLDSLGQRFDYRDIAILVRRNADVELLTQWLLEEDIPVMSERTSNVQDNALIQELMALLTFLESPIDNVAFATFILGDIFTQGTGLSKADMHHFVFSLRDRLGSKNDIYIYTEFRERYPRIWQQYLEEFFKNAGLYPLYEFMVSLYGCYRCLDRFPEHQAFLMHFLELIKQNEDEQVSMGSFLEYFNNLEGEDLYISVAQTNAVEILTIHKAKGLEFPVVILPFLGMDVQVGSSQGDKNQSYVLQEQDRGLRLLRLKDKYYCFSDDLYQIYRAEYVRGFLSELNNIYVALTRAQHEMYLFLPKKIGSSFNILKFLIPEEYYFCGEPGGESNASSSSRRAGPVILPPVPHQNWIDYLKEEFMDMAYLKNRAQRQEGTLVHFILSLVPNCYKRDPEQMLARAGSEAGRVFSRDAPVKECLDQVRTLLNKESLRRFFYIEEGRVKTEVDVVTRQGQTRRVDRLIVTEGEAWVIDYKRTRERQEDYRRQVKDYMGLAAELYPQKNVKGFILYWQEGDVEEVSG